MGILERIRQPHDLRGLSDDDLDALAQEIRDVLIAAVSKNGGHLGPNLGVVELSIAAHRAFDSPHDPIVFDVGHQAYVHKLLTGRAADFSSIKTEGGLSGYPCQAESEHDWVENSHASTALSYADGMAKAFSVRGERDRTVVAVVGDGALTGGMAWEALNNIAGDPQTGADRRPIVIIVNDNGRSYSPTVGGLAKQLSGLRTDPRYEEALDLVKRTLGRTPLVGQSLYDALHGLKKGLKDLLSPQGMFEDLGLKYIGPIDGHDRGTLETAFTQAKKFGGPVIVHCVTQKGYGYEPAIRDQADHMHGPGAFDPATGLPTSASKRSWDKVFSETLMSAARERDDVVAITAAMLGPTGLEPFAQEFPDRCFDVGIAEQHAATSAAGMAIAGLHPVVAIYSTFLNRAFDQVIMDCALHNAGVTFAVSRAGVTGSDGPSHNGMWDLSVLQVVPGLRIAAPRDEATLVDEFREALDIDDVPTVVRYAKGAVPPPLPAIESVGGCDVLARGARDDVLLVAVGAMAHVGVDAASRLAAQGIDVTVIDPRWIKPVNPALVDAARAHRLVVTVEDNCVAGGAGSALADTLRDNDVTTPVRTFGIPHRFLTHAKREAILDTLGLTGQGLAREIAGFVAALDHSAASSTTAGDQTTTV